MRRSEERVGHEDLDIASLQTMVLRTDIVYCVEVELLETNGKKRSCVIPATRMALQVPNHEPIWKSAKVYRHARPLITGLLDFTCTVLQPHNTFWTIVEDILSQGFQQTKSISAQYD